MTRNRYQEFWNRRGCIISTWGGVFPVDRQVVQADKPEQPLIGDQYFNAELLAAWERYRLSYAVYPGDMVPFAFCDYGTVSLAPMFGARQHAADQTIWYSPAHGGLGPEHDRSLHLDISNPWYQKLLELARTGKTYAADDYFCALPSVSGGLDVLAELMGAQQLAIELIQNPEWVSRKLQEIEDTSRQVYRDLYQILKEPDGSVFQGFFMVWAPGTVSLIQCDFAAMISQKMFRDFCEPYIRQAAEFLDYSLYHVDGPDALRSIDVLLEIEELDCIEFTPGPKVPQGGDPCWYDLYKKIKSAKKCVQAVELNPAHVVPLLDEVGPEGMYLMVNFTSEQEVYETLKQVEQFR